MDNPTIHMSMLQQFSVAISHALVLHLLASWCSKVFVTESMLTLWYKKPSCR